MKRIKSGTTSTGASGIASKGAMTNRSSTPANMPAATVIGMRSISRRRGVATDDSKINKAVTIKAPTAVCISSPAPEAAISAAPGVDQAVMMGRRCRRLRIAVEPAMAQQMAVIHDAVSARVACTASAAASTMAIDPPQPTMAAVTAARRGAKDMPDVTLQQMMNCSTRRPHALGAEIVRARSSRLQPCRIRSQQSRC